MIQFQTEGRLLTIPTSEVNIRNMTVHVIGKNTILVAFRSSSDKTVLAFYVELDIRFIDLNGNEKTLSRTDRPILLDRDNFGVLCGHIFATNIEGKLEDINL